MSGQLRQGPAPRESQSAAARRLHARDHRVLALEDALSGLERLNRDLAHLKELRGMTIAETVAALGVSPSVVKREWAAARA